MESNTAKRMNTSPEMIYKKSGSRLRSGRNSSPRTERTRNNEVGPLPTVSLTAILPRAKYPAETCDRLGHETGFARTTGRRRTEG